VLFLSKYLLVGYKDDAQDVEEEEAEKSQDERRWKSADKDEDGMLSKEEFHTFLHPEEAEHMKQSLIEVQISL